MQSIQPNPFAPPEADLEAHGNRPDQSLQLAYKLSRVDYLLWNVYHQFSTPMNQVLMLGVAGFIAYMEAARVPWFTMFLGIYLVFWMCQVLLVSLIVAMGKNRLLLTDYSTALAPHGLLVHTKYSKSLHYWAGIDRVRKGPGFIAVYTSTHGAHVIPKRAFSNPAQLSQFLSVLEARRGDA